MLAGHHFPAESQMKYNGFNLVFSTLTWLPSDWSYPAKIMSYFGDVFTASLVEVSGEEETWYECVVFNEPLSD